MKNIEYGDGVYHMDGTHGIVNNRFRLDVFGITDRQDHFLPVWLRYVDDIFILI